MLLIPCPWCGPRDETEFRYGGQAGIVTPPDPDAIDAWRSNCPRLAVWDDAVTAGLVTAGRKGVALTEPGAAALNGGD